MLARFTSLLALLAVTFTAHSWASESDPIGPDTPVATVNGQAITLRTLENHLLREEGAEAVVKLVENQLKYAQWDRIQDDATVVAMGNWKLPRNVLAAQLLSQNGGGVRDQLIQIALVEQALREDGIIIGDLLLQAERERMEQRFNARLVEMQQPQIPFDQFIAQTQQMTMPEFMAQPGFRMLAGLHALVLRRAEVKEADLEKFYQDNRGNFGNPEQVRLRAILLDFEVSDGPEGRPVVLQQHRERLRLTAAQLQRQITSGSSTFARQWELWGRARDPQAGPGGDVGWVARDGQRAQMGSIPLPPRLLTEAFRVISDGDGSLPKMLPLVEDSMGVVLAEVTDYRAEKIIPFSDVRDRVRRLYLEQNMEVASRDIMHALRSAANIEFGSLGRIVHVRNEELRRLTQPGLDGSEATENAEQE